MAIIDEEGKLFGVVNVIDLFVVIVLLGLVSVGTMTILGADNADSSPEKTTVTFRVTAIQPYVADVIDTGKVPTENIVRVTDKSVRPATTVVPDDEGQLHERASPRTKTVTLRIILLATADGDDHIFAGDALYVGRKLNLDLGNVKVTGNVTVINSST